MTGEYKRQGTVDEVWNVTSLGGGLKIVEDEYVDLEHPLATWLLELEEFEGDRKLKQDHVDTLVRTMQRGTFRPELVVLSACEFDGKTYRMNGQHTAWARLEMPEKWPCEVRLITYRATKYEDMRLLYSSIDRASPRTRSNVMSAYLTGTEEFKDVKVIPLRLLGPALSLWKWEAKNERKRNDADDVAYLLKTEYYDVALKVGLFLNQFANTKTHGFLQRSPVVAAMFATFSRNMKMSIEFWEPVGSGVGFSTAHDPRNKLRTELLQTTVASLRAGKKALSQESMYRMCLYAWNAFRQGRKLKILVKPGEEKGKRPRVR